jgi:hypothetical protein
MLLKEIFENIHEMTFGECSFYWRPFLTPGSASPLKITSNAQPKNGTAKVWQPPIDRIAGPGRRMLSGTGAVSCSADPSQAQDDAA